MIDIEWKENAVCYANGKYWYHSYNKDLFDNNLSFESLFHSDFQLNEIREGDYIPASELDTEQKYNDVVEVLKSYGVTGGLINISYQVASGLHDGDDERFVIHKAGDGELCFGFIARDFRYFCKRQLTYSQIIAIGKLKRMMLERAKCGAVSGADLTAGNADQVKNPKHYQIIEGVESIEIIARSMTKEQWKGFCLGNMLKYRIRAGKKDALQQDIEKANFYGDLYEMHKEKCYD